MSETQFKRAIMIVVLVFLPPLLAAALLGSGMQIPLVSVIVASVVALLVVSIFRPGSGFVEPDPDDLPAYEGPVRLDRFSRVEVLMTKARVWVLHDRDGAEYRLDLDSRQGEELRALLQGEADLGALDEAADGESIVTVWRSDEQEA